MEKLLSELAAIPGLKISEDADLKLLSYWKIGGLVRLLAEPTSIECLAETVKLTKSYDIPMMVIGDCSNLLFDDHGFDGVIIKIGNELNKIEFNGTKAYCEAGVWVPGLAYHTYRRGLSGLEHACGIPGRLGGLIYMNGGASRRAISENLESIVLISEDGEIATVNSSEFEFAYRTSPFQDDKYVIAAATLKFEQSERFIVRSAMRKVLSSRRGKFPRKLPNCGSVFASNPAMYETVGAPGFAIEKAGLKGLKVGGGQISPMHANFIINLGNATAADVLSLINTAREKVHKDTGFYMDCEVRYVAPDGTTCKAHEAIL